MEAWTWTDIVGALFGCCFCILPALFFLTLFAIGILEGREVRRAVEKTSEEEKQELLRLADSLVPDKPNAVILEPTGERLDENLTLVRLPNGLVDYPWGGRCVSVAKRVKGAGWPECTFVDSEFDGIVIRGRIYRTRPVAQSTTKKGKTRNVYSSYQLLKAAPELNARLKRLYPREPAEFLDRIRPPSDGSESRIGGSAYWPQSPLFPKCAVCGKRMCLIVQFSPSDLGDMSDCMLYFFGCRTHPDSTQTDGSCF